MKNYTFIKNESRSSKGFHCLQLSTPENVFVSMKFIFCFCCLLLLSRLPVFAQVPPSLPPSEINIPLSIDLRAVAAVAEKNVSTVFTSPNYPNDWIESDCSTRYKYQFRRSPFTMQMTGNRLDLRFTGLYKITGSTRACVNGTILSPWTPPCRCGFDEGERRVNISFSSFFTLQRNYLLQTKIVRNEPQAIDKCEVCFWGQNVTSSVLKGLKSELDLSKKNMEVSFGNINLKPYMQRAWNVLNDVYSIPNVGYFSLHPKNLRMENISGKNNLLNINIGISANPVISFTKPSTTFSAIPDLSASSGKQGFSIFLEAALQYDSLTTVLNNALTKKRFEISEGLIKKHIIVENTKISGKPNGDMLIQVDFSGSFNGTAYFSGTPVYDPNSQTVFVKNLDYDLQTRNLLLNTAKWLFNNRIKNEMSKYTRFSLADYYGTAAKAIDSWLNKEWVKGVQSSGAVKDLKLLSVQALPDHLLITTNCSGNLNLLISQIDLNL